MTREPKARIDTLLKVADEEFLEGGISRASIWGKPGEGARIVIAGKDNDTVPVGTLSSIRRASGLEGLR